MTTLDHLKSDFGWVADVLRTLAELAPILALIWAIHAFFAQRKTDRADNLRQRRLEIYVEYLQAIDAVSASDFDDMPDYGLAVMSATKRAHAKITLMAPDEVAKASLRFNHANIGSHLWDGKERLLTMSGQIKKHGVPLSADYLAKHHAATKPYRDARSELVRAMRRDLVVGSDVLPGLTDVEDLENS